MTRSGKILLVLAALSLSGCETMTQTMSVVKERISSIDLTMPSFSSRHAADSVAAEAVEDNCPVVTVVEDLRTINQFLDAGTSKENGTISAASITGIQKSCVVNENNIAVDMGILFSGRLGKTVQAWNTANPSFAYPYFVAITTTQGTIVAKEVFAATVTYEQGQTETTFTEHLRQIIPVPADAAAPAYELLIGFQLSEAELAYNNSLKAAMTQAAPVMEPIVEKPAPVKKAATYKKPPKPKRKPQIAKAAEDAPVLIEEVPAAPPAVTAPAQPEPAPDAAATPDDIAPEEEAAPPTIPPSAADQGDDITAPVQPAP